MKAFAFVPRNQFDSNEENENGFYSFIHANTPTMWSSLALSLWPSLSHMTCEVSSNRCRYHRIDVDIDKRQRMTTIRRLEEVGRPIQTSNGGTKRTQKACSISIFCSFHFAHFRFLDNSINNQICTALPLLPKHSRESPMARQAPHPHTFDARCLSIE